MRGASEKVFMSFKWNITIDTGKWTFDAGKMELDSNKINLLKIYILSFELGVSRINR